MKGNGANIFIIKGIKVRIQYTIDEYIQSDNQQGNLIENVGFEKPQICREYPVFLQKPKEEKSRYSFAPHHREFGIILFYLDP